MNENTTLIITILSIVAGILFLALVLFLIFYPIIKKHYMYRNFRYVYYKKIRAIADKNDFLLLNDIVVKDKEKILCNIDHILFGKKYIYVIKDRYYRGAINGKKEDNNWVFINNKDEKVDISNPMKRNKTRIEMLSAMTSISQDLFVSIVLVNNDCYISSPDSLRAKRSFVIPYKKLNSLINKLEKRNVKNIDQKMLEYAVQDIYRFYGKGRLENDE